MPPRVLALLSGGLDSMLAVAVVQGQGVEVEALHFRTPFTQLTQLATQAAERLQVPLTFLDADASYLQLLSEPRFGRQQQAAPCLDCRGYLLHRAAEVLAERAAPFLVTGEVLGQRRWGQRRRDFAAFEHRAELAGQIERPLSGKLLPITKAQQQGWLDRSRLHSFQGKGRRPQLALAEQLGWKNLPAPLARCCLLAESKVAARLLQAVEKSAPLSLLGCELMAAGEQQMLSESVTLNISRNASEAQQLQEITARYQGYPLTLLVPHNAIGPSGLMHGEATASRIVEAARLLQSRCKVLQSEPVEFRVTGGSAERSTLVAAADECLARVQNGDQPFSFTIAANPSR